MEIVDIVKYAETIALTMCSVPTTSALDPLTCPVSSGHNHVDFGFALMAFRGQLFNELPWCPVTTWMQA